MWFPGIVNEKPGNYWEKAVNGEKNLNSFPHPQLSFTVIKETTGQNH
jgi:hypothetical protein